MWCLTAAGWTLPAISIIPYTYCRSKQNVCGMSALINEESKRWVVTISICNFDTKQLITHKNQINVITKSS